jgi:DNA-binding response OmpR family regulator
LVEDEASVVTGVRRALEAEGYEVDVATDGRDGLDLLVAGEYDVALLDVMLPGMNGYELCRTARRHGVQASILMVSAKNGEWDIAEGLDLGADDYLTKPFDFDELLARIEALVRRSHNFAPSSNVLKVADLVLDRELLEVRRGSDTIKLTAKELAILELLMSAPGRVFSRTRILNQVWGYSEDPLTNVVDVYIARLRRKIDPPGREPLLETVRGHGYRLKAPG